MLPRPACGQSPSCKSKTTLGEPRRFFPSCSVQFGPDGQCAWQVVQDHRTRPFPKALTDKHDGQGNQELLDFRSAQYSADYAAIPAKEIRTRRRQKALPMLTARHFGADLPKP